MQSAGDFGRRRQNAGVQKASVTKNDADGSSAARRSREADLKQVRASGGVVPWTTRPLLSTDTTFALYLPPAAWASSSRTLRWLRSASPSQQHSDAVQLAVRNAQALSELHTARPAPRQHSELLHSRSEQLRAMPSSRPRAVSRMAQAADLHLPPARAFDHVDLDLLHRREPLES